MSTRREYEQGYALFYRSLANFLKNSAGFPVSGVARRGSRYKGTHRDKSDLDVIFAISENPSKREVYPPLIERLKKTMNVRADVGSSYNALNIWKDRISCNLVLRTQTQFRNQINNNEYQEL
jgi:predicted nucleotidyltransferase